MPSDASEELCFARFARPGTTRESDLPAGEGREKGKLHAPKGSRGWREEQTSHPCVALHATQVLS